jgi:PPM family protein phosphatase
VVVCIRFKVGSKMGSMHAQGEGGSQRMKQQSSEAQDLAPAAITDTGTERDLNEDRYAVIESDSGVAWIVCDGMGGVTGGELAAQLAIDAIRRELTGKGPQQSDEALSAALTEANRTIVLRRQNQAFSSMGTTAVMALFQGAEVTISHVGDSRAYLVRGGIIQQLTVDHTYVQTLVDKGEIELDEALTHPDAHILTRCIGSQAGLDLEIMKFWIWPIDEQEVSDHLVMVTDGLYSMVSDEELAEIISESDSQSACASLVDLANKRGGFDNITVAIIPVGGQLRSEAPPGFVSMKIKNENGPGSEVSLSLARWIVVAMMLTVLLVAIVGGIVFFAVR